MRQSSRCGGKSRRYRRHSPFDRPSAGAGGAEPVSGHASHDRADDRGRLLLRFRPAASVHARGSAENRAEDARTGQGRPEGRAGRGAAAPKRSRPSSGWASIIRSKSCSGIPEGEHVSIYRQGDWMDLCRGPHVPSTRYIRAFKLTSVAGAYWRGDEHNAMLSRIYGTSFASKEALEEHLQMIELARARDHRKLGREMGLFVFDPISPGQPFYPAQRRWSSSIDLVDYMQAALPPLWFRRGDYAADLSRTSCGIRRAIGTIFARTCS